LDADSHPLSDDKFKERIMLLRRYLYHLEWPMPNEVRTKISQEIFNSQLPIDQAVSFEKLAKTLQGNGRTTKKRTPSIQTTLVAN